MPASQKDTADAKVAPRTSRIMRRRLLRACGRFERDLDLFQARAERLLELLQQPKSARADWWQSNVERYRGYFLEGRQSLINEGVLFLRFAERHGLSKSHLERLVATLHRHEEPDVSLLAELKRFDKRGLTEFSHIIVRAKANDAEHMPHKAAPVTNPPDGPEPPKAPATPPLTPDRGVGVVLQGENEQPIVMGKHKPVLTPAKYAVVKALVDARDKGLGRISGELLDKMSHRTDSRKHLVELCEDSDWKAVIITPEGRKGAGYGIR